MLRVAEDKPILVNVVGRDDVTKFDATGFILVQEQDWAQIVKKLKEKK